MEIVGSIANSSPRFSLLWCLHFAIHKHSRNHRSPRIPPQRTWNGWEQASFPSAYLVGDGKAVGFSASYLPFWRRAWQLTPVFLPGKSYGLRILVGYSP